MSVSSQTANDLMTVFSNTVTAGFASLSGPVNGIFGLMIALVVALTGIQWAVSANRDALAGAFSKILLIGAFAYIINDWQGLSETVFAGFMAIGLQAGGGGIGAGDFLNPGAVIETGWQIVKAIGDAPTVTENPLDVIGNFVDAIIIGISMLGIMIAFTILALQIIVTLLEFKIVTLGGFILLPFGIFSKTSFMAERPLGYVVAAGLKVLALTIIVSGAQTVFAQLIPSPEPDIYEALTILTASIILAMLSIFAPNLAAALVSGGPALGAGALTVGGLAVGAAGGAAIAGTMAAGGAMAGTASKIASASKAAAGASAGKPPMGGGPSGAGPSSAAAGSPTGLRGPSGGGGSSATASTGAEGNQHASTATRSPAVTGRQSDGAQLAGQGKAVGPSAGGNAPSAPSATPGSGSAEKASKVATAATNAPDTTSQGAVSTVSRSTQEAAGGAAAWTASAPSNSDTPSTDDGARTPVAPQQTRTVGTGQAAGKTGSSVNPASANRMDGAGIAPKEGASEVAASVASATTPTRPSVYGSNESGKSGLGGNPASDGIASGSTSGPFGAGSAVASASSPYAASASTPAPGHASGASNGGSGSPANSAAGAATGAPGATPSPQRYHRFPEASPGEPGGRARAFNAFWTANAARQLMPANENGGSLNPSIREED